MTESPVRWSAVSLESWLAVGQPGLDGGPKAVGSGTRSSEASNEHNEEGSITAVVGLTVRAPGQVPADGRGLFRRKLAVKIFPQSPGDLGTFHRHTFPLGLGPDRPVATPS